MLNLVYFHVNGGSFGLPPSPYSYAGLPDYAFSVIGHNAKAVPGARCFMLCDPTQLGPGQADALQRVGVDIVNFTSLPSDGGFERFAAAYKASRYDRGLGSCFMNSLAKTYFIEMFMAAGGVSDVLYSEYDVLLMHDVSAMPELFDFKFKTCVVNDRTTCQGLAYFKDRQVAADLNAQIIVELERGSFQGCVNDMVLTAAAVRRLGWWGKCFFNSVPDGRPVVDPCTYGQYLYGTNQGHPPGFLDRSRDLDQFLSGSAEKLLFGTDGGGYVQLGGRRSPLVSLHVHRKSEIAKAVDLYGRRP